MEQRIDLVGKNLKLDFNNDCDGAVKESQARTEAGEKNLTVVVAKYKNNILFDTDILYHWEDMS